MKDRFELLRANEIPDSEREKATRYHDLPIFGTPDHRVRLGWPIRTSHPYHVRFRRGRGLAALSRSIVEYDNVRAQALARAGRIAKLRELNAGGARRGGPPLGRIYSARERNRLPAAQGDKRELTALDRRGRTRSSSPSRRCAPWK